MGPLAASRAAAFEQVEAAAAAALDLALERGADPSHGLALAAAAADLAWHDHPGRFASSALERGLAAVGRQQVPDLGVAGRPWSDGPRRVLHLLTEAHPVGGHTRLAWRWMALDDGRSHSVVLTGQPGHVAVPDELRTASAASGGAWTDLGPDDLGPDARGPDGPRGLISKARVLRALAADHDAVVVHGHPFDVLPALAFAAPGPDRRPVVWVNHVDQGFWLGTAVADVVLDVRGSVLDLAARRRGILRETQILVPLPLEPLERTQTQAEAKAQLGLDPAAKVLLTIAHPYKFAGVSGAGGRGFLGPATELLARRTDAVLLAVGPDPTGDWAEAGVATGGRIRALGYQRDLQALYEAADVVLDPFPFCSGTSVLEAALLGVPSVLLAEEPAGAEVLGTDLPGAADGALVRATDPAGWAAAIEALLDDDDLRRRTGERLRTAVEDGHRTPGWTRHIEAVWAAAAAANPASPPPPDIELGRPDRLDELLLAVHEASGRLEGRDDVLARHGLSVADLAPPRPSGSLTSIAFFLPQFHPIAVNDEAWGPGFTEWTNVVKARPGFDGHHQPHLPADLGFYDLRLAETRAAQARLARGAGIDALCWYHYWFGGRRLLEQPFEAMRAGGEPDLPFLLCWANEAWRRNWDGRTGTVLVEQAYSAGDDEAHARHLVEVFHDPRYLCVDGRPVFLLYRAKDHDDPARFTAALRAEAVRAGLPDPLLLRVASMGDEHDDPRPLGFDAEVDFQPDWDRLPAPRTDLGDRLVFDHAAVVEAMEARPAPAWRRHPCVTPRWDNTPRRATGAHVLAGSTPALYRSWVARAGAKALAQAEGGAAGGSALLFVNAWNEWGEGAHLEPDDVHGHAYLDAHRDGVVDALLGRVVAPPPSTAIGPPVATAPPIPPDPLRVGIVLVVRDGVADTLSCLESLIEHTPEDRYQVVVVDDGSTDATPQLLASLEGDVQVVTNGTPVGLEAAREQGAALVADEDVVVFLEAGARLHAGWLDQIVAEALAPAT